MSDDGFEELRDSAIEPLDLFDKPDIDQYLTDYEPEWLELWDASPVEDMSEGQIEALIDMVIDNDFSDYTWEEMLADIYEDFWEWYNEHYGGG